MLISFAFYLMTVMISVIELELQTLSLNLYSVNFIPFVIRELKNSSIPTHVHLNLMLWLWRSVCMCRYIIKWKKNTQLDLTK